MFSSIWRAWKAAAPRRSLRTRWLSALLRLRSHIASLQPPLLSDDLGNRSRGFHRAGTELADWRAGKLHCRQGDPRDRFARRVNMLTCFVLAAGPTGQEHRDVF